MSKYDGWTIKDKFGLDGYFFRQKRIDVVKCFNKLMLAKDNPSWSWKNFKRRRGDKIVKVKLMEVFND